MCRAASIRRDLRGHCRIGPLPATMAFPATQDSTDPTSQIAWPGRRTAEQNDDATGDDAANTAEDVRIGVAGQSLSPAGPKHHMSRLQLFTLSVSMGASWMVRMLSMN